MTQVELAEIIGDSQQAISDFLKKDGNPQKKTKEKYFDKLEGFYEFYNTNTSLSLNRRALLNITEQDAMKVIELIYLYEDELMEYEDFALWVEAKKAEEKNAVLKNILKQKLDKL